MNSRKKEDIQTHSYELRSRFSVLTIIGAFVSRIENRTTALLQTVVCRSSRCTSSIAIRFPFRKAFTMTIDIVHAHIKKGWTIITDIDELTSA